MPSTSVLTTKAKAAIYDTLEQLVQHGTEKRGEAVALMWDEEDGFFLSTVDTGCRHYPVKDLGGQRHKRLAGAVIAAAEWHNRQGERWYMSHLKRVAVPVVT